MRKTLLAMACIGVFCAAQADNEAKTAKSLIPELTTTVDSHLKAKTTLIRMGKESVPALIKGMASRDELIRTQCAAILAAQGPKVIPSLRTAMNSSEWRVRSSACMALGAMPETRAGTNLLIDALDDSDWWVRCSAANALAGTNDARALTALQEMQQDDPDERVRMRASIALDSTVDLAPPKK